MTFRTISLAAAVALALLWSLPAAARAQGVPPPPPPVPPSPSASPSPSAVPTPEPVATTGPTAAPSASPGIPIPIRLDRSRVGVVPGTSVAVHVSGGAGPLVVSPSFSGVDADYDEAAHTLTLRGVANGRGTVTLNDSAGDSAVVAVLVAPPAGVVPPDVTIDLAGNISPQFATARIHDTVAQLAQLQPNATAGIGGVTVGALHPGDSVNLLVRTTLSGNDTFVDQTGTTNVHLRVAALPHLDPLVLFYSDDPERLGPLDDGVLFRGTIDATRPARAYVYHVSDVPRQLYLALSAATGIAHVQVLGAYAGPSDAFSYVGHLATVRYLIERAPQESVVLTVAPGAPAIVPLGAGPILAGQLVAAIDDLRVVDGGPVNVMVVAAGTGFDPATLLSQPEHPSDGHFRRGEFSLANVPPLALSYTAGASEPAPVTFGFRYDANGRAAFPNLRADIVAAAGQRAPLSGDYGVLRTVALTLANPTATLQSLYLYEQPGANGGVTTTMWFDGDTAPTEVRCVSDPAQRYLVKAFAVAPGQTLNVSGSYMTDGTSFLPISFGLTATQPPLAPANGCGPKPDAPQ